MNMIDASGRRLRHLGLAAAALLAGGVILSVPAAAHPEHGDGGRRMERVIILPSGEHDARSTARHIQIIEMGGPEGVRCGGDRSEVNETSPDGREKTRIIVCGNQRLSSADRAEKLEKALSRIQQNDELSAEHKARVTAALREAIDRMRETR